MPTQYIKHKLNPFVHSTGSEAGSGIPALGQAVRAWPWAAEQETLAVSTEGRAARFISELMEANSHHFPMIYTQHTTAKLS